jgi:hypothetical protein
MHLLDTIEREIDQEVRARFPGSAVRQAVLLQYGDDPEIEPRDLLVRVLLEGRAGGQLGAGLDGSRASQRDGDRAVPGRPGSKFREISLVEYTFSNNPITCDGHGLRAGMPVAQRLSDIQEREHGVDHSISSLASFEQR